MVKTPRTGVVVSCGVTLLAFALFAGGDPASPGTANASALRRSAIVRAVDQAKPSVVNIHGRKTVPGDYAQSGASFRQVNGMGTGVVIDERGYILTNYHVIENVRRIEVTLVDNQTYVASLVAHDPNTDLAVIKISAAKPLKVITIGSSHDLMEGETVVAVGNAYGYQHTVTQGIISALHRSVQVSDEQGYDDLIQTDASINPGNSGGPLLNIDGEMIGINVAVRVGAQGIGFAIPVNEALDVAAGLFNVERVDRLTHGLSGITEVVDEQHRFVVDSVHSNGPADKAGLQSGDVVESVDDKSIHTALDFERALLGRQEGAECELAVTRDGQRLAKRLALDNAGKTTGVASDRAWESLGVKLAPLASDVFRRFNTRYRGGLKVTSVRPDGPAYKEGIRRGDVLVGMHKWETVSLDNVDYILNHAEIGDADPVKFFIVRGNETLFGHMRVSAHTR